MLNVKQFDGVSMREARLENRKIGKELRSLNNLIRRYLENHAHKKTVDNITGTNGWIIGYLSDRAGHDVFQRDLEVEFSITRSTASKVIDLMVRKGLIERQSVPYDGRLKKLVLTEKAQEISSWMQEDGVRLEAALLNGFTNDELTRLLTYLERMKNNLAD